MPDGFVKQFSDSVIALVTSHSGLFVNEGMKELRLIGTILIVWEFFMLLRGDGGHGIVNSLMQIAVCFAVLTFYVEPFPGTNSNFHQVITDEGTWLAQQIDTGMEEQIGRKLADFQSNVPRPVGAELLNFASVVQYLAVTGLLAVAQIVMVAVLGLGFFVIGTLVLAGPIFIPLMLVPHLSWLAWGWFRSLIQYSLYPFFGNCFVWVFGQIWMNFFNQHLGPMDSSTAAAIFMQIVVFSGVFIWGFLKLPAVISSVCSGGSFGQWMPGIGIWR